MGMTRKRDGMEASADGRFTVALMGNPNVGKSTLFNALTGLSRHTGNWTGKTVDISAGYMKADSLIELYDLPGCYGLSAGSPEEETARGFILSGRAELFVTVLDASCLERSLALALQTLDITRNVIVCVNLADEAKKHGITVDGEALSKLLGTPVVLTSAASGKGLDELIKEIKGQLLSINRDESSHYAPEYSPKSHWEEAASIAEKVVSRDSDPRGARQLKLDRLLTGRFTGGLVMAALLAAVFFLTMEGANLPSKWLSELFGLMLGAARSGLEALRLPSAVVSAICDGVLGTLSTVISVMLPPMAIFFPMFTLLEDLGLLPRIAFDLDRSFAKCGSCGKQALTCCMGFGCNAAGVVGCRIIESPRERLIAVLTNSLIPCNGRFPALTALIAAFFASGAGALSGAVRAGMLTGLILLSLGMTLLISRLLSLTLLKGQVSHFVLELPPFRKPRIGSIIVRSMLDRTLFVLGRAAAVAAPAGLVIWLLKEFSGLAPLVGLLDPIGKLLGLDGAVMLAFVLALPANELVMPLILTIYSAVGAGAGTGTLFAALSANGWNAGTALCMLLLILFHSPCATTLLTIARETRSAKWTFFAFLIPVLTGILLCAAVNGALRLF